MFSGYITRVYAESDVVGTGDIKGLNHKKINYYTVTDGTNYFDIDEKTLIFKMISNELKIKNAEPKRKKGRSGSQLDIDDYEIKINDNLSKVESTLFYSNLADGIINFNGSEFVITTILVKLNDLNNRDKLDNKLISFKSELINLLDLFIRYMKNIDYKYCKIVPITCGFEYEHPDKERELVELNRRCISYPDRDVRLNKVIEDPMNITELNPIIRDALSRVNRTEIDRETARGVLNIYYGTLHNCCKLNIAGKVLYYLYVDNLLKIINHKLKNPNWHIDNNSVLLQITPEQKKAALEKGLKYYEKVTADRLEELRGVASEINKTVDKYSSRLDELFMIPLQFQSNGIPYGKKVNEYINEYSKVVEEIQICVAKTFSNTITSDSLSVVYNNVTRSVCDPIDNSILKCIARILSQAFPLMMGKCIVLSDIGLNHNSKSVFKLASNWTPDLIEVASYFVNKQVCLKHSGNYSSQSYRFQDPYVKSFFEFYISKNDDIRKRNLVGLKRIPKNDPVMLSRQAVVEKAFLITYMIMYNKVNPKLREIKETPTIYLFGVFDTCLISSYTNSKLGYHNTYKVLNESFNDLCYIMNGVGRYWFRMDPKPVYARKYSIYYENTSEFKMKAKAEKDRIRAEIEQDNKSEEECLSKLPKAIRHNLIDVDSILL